MGENDHFVELTDEKDLDPNFKLQDIGIDVNLMPQDNVINNAIMVL